MALKFIEGFDEITPASAAADLTSARSSNEYYYVGGNSPTISSTITRTTQTTGASQSLRLDGATNLALRTPGITEVFVGFGYYPGSAGNGYFLELTSTSAATNTTGIGFYRNTMGDILVYRRDNSSLLGTASGALVNMTWQYIEIRAKLSSTVGEVEVRVNGTTCLSLTGVNTAGTLSSYTVINLTNYNPGGGNYTYFDDYYVCDTTGTTNNTFLGPLSVYTLYPTGAGSSTQLTPVGAASNYDCVDDANYDTTTYVRSTASNQVDYYTMSDLPAITPTSVPGIMVKARSTKGDNGSRTVTLKAKVGAGESSSSPRNLTFASWLTDHVVYETVPGGAAAWTKSDVDSLEAGVSST